MSNLALLGQADSIIDALASGQPVEIDLPAGGRVRAFPEAVVDQFGNPMLGRDGTELYNLHYQSETEHGVLSGVVQLERKYIDHCIAKVKRLLPRAQQLSERLLLRAGGGDDGGRGR